MFEDSSQRIITDFFNLVFAKLKRNLKNSKIKRKKAFVCN